MVIACFTVMLAAVDFWYWMVLPMPPQHDPGLSYENFYPWLVGFVLISAAAGAIEGQALRAAGIVALAQPITYLPYVLSGYSDRNYAPLQLRWSNALNVGTTLMLVIYLSIGVTLAIVPAAAGTFIQQYAATKRPRAIP